ncbi:hypothetical protein [Acidisphaera sp. L21]|jgi:hypothetical protein|uniref:hypothetical protein n=1 Tax=Acidisphaera sp. L21 TaxID=1641851 RepID=UPI00131D95EC|nr:hypothetical protein [Acidisphaera sp. L21]
MKLQPTRGALPTESILLSLEEYTASDDSKLCLGDCVTILMQLTLSLGACGLLHWAFA